MAIVSDLPFTLKLINHFSNSSQEAILFADDDREIWEDGFVTLSVEENEEIGMYFNSSDQDARLYLEALDIVPIDDFNIKEDEEGEIYRTVSDSDFVLYKSDGRYDALRVDVFRIAVLCSEKWYYGVFQVLPKPMTMSDWQMMKDDLEREINGLAQDIVRRNIGIGNLYSEKIPPKLLYDFFVMKKYADRVMMALMDISENPRSEIVTGYRNVENNQSFKYCFDAETVKRFSMRSGSEATLKVPVKMVRYDIQDNRLLKMILTDYESKLQQFIDLISELEEMPQEFNLGDSMQYKISWKKTLSDFRKNAQKLKKMTAIIKVQDWYLEVAGHAGPYIPHSFVLDSRYNLLYQMYQDLKKEEICVEINPNFSYTWKRSSYMYEMWCYLKVCRLLMEEYEIIPPRWGEMFSGKMIFPFLEAGTKLCFEKDGLVLEAIYDQWLPLGGAGASLNHPLYIARHLGEGRLHNRPDIVVNVFEKSKQMYLGSIIIECKYRKLHSFLSDDPERGSGGQLETYFNNARSKVLLGGYGEEWKMRPVTRVLVLTPDDLGDGVERQDYEIIVKGFKASDDYNRAESVKQVIVSEISSLKKRFAMVVH